MTSILSAANGCATWTDNSRPLRVPGANATLEAHLDRPVGVYLRRGESVGISIGGLLHRDGDDYSVEVRDPFTQDVATVLFCAGDVAAFVRARTGALLIILAS